MTPLATAVTTALVHSVWQDAIVAGALAVALALLRGGSAQSRYAAACAALAAMVLLPVFTGVLVYEPIGSAAFAQRVAIPLTREAPVSSRVVAVGAHAATETAWLAAVRPWVLPLWCAGVLLCSLRLIGSGVHAGRLRRAGAIANDDMRRTVGRLAAAMGITRRVAVIVPPDGGGAATLGWLRPVILMPTAAAMGLTPQQFEALIVHELAHIRRCDYLVNAAQMVVETVFFYHPAIWWASHRIRIERELCCDDVAVRWTGDARGYARAIAAVAGWRPQAALGAAGGPLVHRIDRLLGLHMHRRTRPARGSVLAAVLVVLAAGAVWADAQTSTLRATGRAGATISGTLYDPFGRPAENTPVAVTGGNVVQPSSTDDDGHFRFVNLPRGRYSLTTPITDAMRPAVIDVGGDDVTVDARLGIDPVAVGIRVCADCRPSPPAVPPSATQPGIPEHAVIVSAEPLGGWDAFNAATREYPPALKSSRAEGSATIEARIAEDGTTVGARAVTAASDRIAAAAAALVEELRWRPTQVRGTPVEVPLQVTVEYVLKD